MSNKNQNDYLSVADFARSTGLSEQEIEGRYTVEFGKRKLVPRFMLDLVDPAKSKDLSSKNNAPEQQEQLITVAEIPIESLTKTRIFEPFKRLLGTNEVISQPSSKNQNPAIDPFDIPQEKAKKRKRRSAKPTEDKNPRVFSRAERTTIVNPFRRLFARSVDLLWEIFLILALAYYLMSVFDASLMQLFDRPLAAIALALLFLPVAMLVDAIVYSFAGNTPGKYIFGLRAVSRKLRILDFGRYFSRNLKLWHGALAYGILPLTLFYMAREGIRVARGMDTLYDENEGTRVTQAANPTIYEPLVGLALFALAIGISAALTVSLFE